MNTIAYTDREDVMAAIDRANCGNGTDDVMQVGLLHHWRVVLTRSRGCNS